MRRAQVFGVVVMLVALIAAIWLNNVHKNPYAGAVIVITVVALGVYFGNLLGEIDLNPMRVFDWFKRWIKDIATTALIIVSGIVLSAIYVLWSLAADTLGRPLSDLTMNTLGMFLMGMLVGGVAQFGVKRFSDDKALAAKHGTALPTRDAPPGDPQQ